MKLLWDVLRIYGCKLSMQQAVNEEKERISKEKNSEINLSVSGDGTWKKRSHISCLEVVTLAENTARKFLIHDVNYKGSVSKMEADSVKDMFSHSVSEYGVKYSRYIGDG
ncbi:hypothetical protein HHI36_003782 [Cryptolaemus montrouzieri]|uniref:Mutator-like transposase domain-containing protein n=1 Tax=Cryptolaemus montrouzieri TaxID=559131 RepID=A0ABD2NPB0_9CUCU